MDYDCKRYVLELGMEIMRLRLKQGFTRKEMALKIKLSKSKIKKIEKNGAITITQFFKIAEILNTKTFDILKTVESKIDISASLKNN